MFTAEDSFKNTGAEPLPDSVSQTEVEIKNPTGLHLRPAMQIADTASRFTSNIKISNGKILVDGKSIMQISMLGAPAGTKLTITAEGPDAQKAIEVLKDLIEKKLFGEQGQQIEGKSVE